MLNGVLMLAVVAVAAAIVLAALWRGAERRAAGSAGERDAALAERDELQARLASENQTRKKQAEELATYRKRADKVKKRQSKTPDQPLGTASRIRDLESQIERAQSAHRALDAEREGLSGRVGELEAQLAVSARELAAALAPSRSIVAETQGALEGAKAEAAEQREQRRKLEEALRLARETEARMRKRMSNQEQLYASLRAELDVKKDRLRTQEEQLQRLQALKVAIVD